jgi:signal peptidase I
MAQAARRVPWLLWAAIALFLLVRRFRGRFVAVEVAGSSMVPALQAGDFVIVARRRPRHAPGAVAYLHGPDARPLLKRVIGLPGESLSVGTQVEVNGQELVEPYAHGTPSAGDYRGVHRLGPDEYFVLGDHRGASTDSRHFGPVRAADIEGIAVLRYWPPERFGRISRAHRRGGGRLHRPS